MSAFPQPLMGQGEYLRRLFGDFKLSFAPRTFGRERTNLAAAYDFLQRFTAIGANLGSVVLDGVNSFEFFLVWVVKSHLIRSFPVNDSLRNFLLSR